MKNTLKTLPLIISIVALLIVIGNVDTARSRQALGVSNFDSIHLSDANATAVPNFVANQRGTGVIAEFRDAATPVVRIANGGGLNVLTGGDLTVADGTILQAQTAISLTDGATLTPTGRIQLVSSNGEVTATLSTAVTTGFYVTLINVNGTNTPLINIADSGTAKLAGALELGDTDTVELWFNGTNWYELDRSDN